MIIKKQNFAITALLVFTLLYIQVTSSAKTTSNLLKEALIPKPVSIISTGGYFILKSQTDIYIQGDSKELKQIGQYLADKLRLSYLDMQYDTTTRLGNFYPSARVPWEKAK
jgi:hypothetical protein